MLVQRYGLVDLRSQYLQDNGTVQVVNTATQGNFSINIVGTATPVDSAYGAGGAFAVSFPGTPPAECPGPNYIVQGMRNIQR
jgi:apolipoprotein D and lipocalin family protein